MTCTQAKAFIQKRLDETLPQPERTALDNHFALCADCRQEWEGQRRLASLTDRWLCRTQELSDPGEQFTAQVLARLEAQPPPRLRLWLPLTASLLLLTALVQVPGGLPSGNGLSFLTRTLQELPGWLLANAAALPDALQSLLRLPHSVPIPAAASSWLLGIALFNGLLWLNARQSARQRSLR